VAYIVKDKMSAEVLISFALGWGQGSFFYRFVNGYEIYGHEAKRYGFQTDDIFTSMYGTFSVILVNTLYPDIN
jgi:hypothetical protein